MIDIEDVRRLQLGPTDVLVVQVKAPITAEVRAKLTAQFGERLQLGPGRVLVIGNMLSLAVVTQEVADAIEAKAT